MKRIKNTPVLIAGMIILQFVFSSSLWAQSKAKIEHVDFFPDGNTLIITYDIAKCKSNETFKIWIDIYTESGTKFTPKALTGDAGNNISCGENKQIIWNMVADQAYLDEDIAVVVLAESELYAPVESYDKPEEEVVKQPKEKKQKEKKSGISVGGAMGLSLILPGLGRKVATGEGAGFLWGVAGYGCLAGSYFLNNSAYNKYEDYKVATTTSERDDLYKKAKNYDTYSKVLIGAAATIWVVDLIITGVKTSKIRKSGGQRLSFTGGYNPVIQQPVLGVTYRF